ncbi:MAG: hypothetical protein Q4F11_06985 [Eubacteriales bacterium]|nr:hypothetical protein [Eubacteriales bacterium]
MAAGVYTTTKKDGSTYYRVSITYQNKHISLGSFYDYALASYIYETAREILQNPDKYYFFAESGMESFHSCPENFPLDKYIVLLNFRENHIYIKTPIFLCKNYFLYILNSETILTFNTDDLFYYSNHKILIRGGYYYVNDYGMQTSILSRYGIRSHAVKDRDYIFRNGNEHDYRYENIFIINKYNGVFQTSKKGRIFYRSKIHINGDFIIGTYDSEEEAAVAYNKAADIISPINGVSYTKNYIENISAIEYAAIYNRIRISKKLLEHNKLS